MPAAGINPRKQGFSTVLKNVKYKTRDFFLILRIFPLYPNYNSNKGWYWGYLSFFFQNRFLGFSLPKGIFFLSGSRNFQQFWLATLNSANTWLDEDSNEGFILLMYSTIRFHSEMPTVGIFHVLEKFVGIKPGIFWNFRNFRVFKKNILKILSQFFHRYADKRWYYLVSEFLSKWVLGEFPSIYAHTYYTYLLISTADLIGLSFVKLWS